VATVRTDQLRSRFTHAAAGVDLWKLLLWHAQHHGQRPAFTWHPFTLETAASWTYAELARDVAAVGAGLVARGVRPGERVLVHLENSPEFVLSWLACVAVGAVAVTTNTRSAADELAYYAADSAIVGAITQPRFAELVSSCAADAKWLVVTAHDSGQPVPDTVGESFTALCGDPDALEERTFDSASPMSIQYTSGTTSRPKGVVWNRANGVWAARVNAAHEALRPDDCHLVYMPLFHANALAYSMLASLWVGARFVVLPKWSTTRFWDISLMHGCTWLSLMGLSARAIATRQTGEMPRDHQYRLFGSGVCELPMDVGLGVKTIGWWGMTETLTQCIVGNPYGPDRPGSMGRPAPEYGIAVVGDDGVTPVEPDQPGELLVRGTPGLSLFAEYLNQPDATAASFDDHGWFRTGDLVTPHSDGSLTFTDRAKDMLKVGAENVAASEVERVLLEGGGLREAAVVARPDDKLDEVPVAFVIPLDGAAVDVGAVMATCRKRLADFKVPREVFVVRELPRSTVNKVNKAQLRAVVTPGSDLETAQKQWVIDAARDPSGDAVD
jgi:crotonobetaine/carnitine-CoA ligase